MKSRSFRTANELWDALSPTTAIFQGQHELLYRGQANAEWSLVPSALRTLPGDDLERVVGSTSPATWQVWLEVRLLEEFARYCDRVGIALPGDSIEFRREHLNNQNIDQYLMHPVRWPNPKLFEVMAFAQHHGVPTRLLDWCRSPYTAAYFAASSAVHAYRSWTEESELAVWLLNIEGKGLYSDHVEVVTVPGAVSPHLAAQAGVFTVQKGKPDASRLSNPPGLEIDIVCAGRDDLLKWTLPVWESEKLLRLCEKVGVSAASLMPSADGAAQAVKDNMYAWAVFEKVQNRQS